MTAEKIDLARALALCSRVELSPAEVREVLAMFPALVQEVRRINGPRPPCAPGAPLTDEEIAATRDALKRLAIWQDEGGAFAIGGGDTINFDDGGDEAADFNTSLNALPRLLDEVLAWRKAVASAPTGEPRPEDVLFMERARALLKRIEWNSPGVIDSETACCPNCGKSKLLNDEHRPGCELAALIS